MKPDQCCSEVYSDYTQIRITANNAQCKNHLSLLSVFRLHIRSVNIYLGFLVSSPKHVCSGKVALHIQHHLHLSTSWMYLYMNLNALGSTAGLCLAQF